MMRLRPGTVDSPPTYGVMSRIPGRGLEQDHRAAAFAPFAARRRCIAEGGRPSVSLVSGLA